jgi:hypothetical protein
LSDPYFHFSELQGSGEHHWETPVYMFHHQINKLILMKLSLGDWQ